jgi:selenocysteine lyase/cysteine desulfurase
MLVGMQINHARKMFPGAKGYLNTAAIGLPPESTMAAMTAAMVQWQAGEAHAPEYDTPVAEARRLFADLMSVPVEWVAIGSQVSALIGLAATALPPGSRVVAPEGEFTSVIFPLLVRDDLHVDFVPLAGLADAIDQWTDMVAFSAVQSADGRVADLEGIAAAAAANQALTLVDATQAAGWLPLDAKRFDFVATGAYKWLLSPRGTAFLTVRPELLDRVRPLYAGWYAGEEPWESIYGAPLRLATDARRLDLSPGWLAWVGTEMSLRLLLDIGVEAINQHDVGLANALLERMGLPSGDSAIVALDLDADFDESRLAGFSTAYRAGRLRVGFHLYNAMEDVDRLAAALRG